MQIKITLNYPRMNPEIKEKWIDALLSGEYEQGQGYLCNDGKYCCMGVLCDLYIKEKGGSWNPAPLEVSDFEKPYVESTTEPGKYEPQTKTLMLYDCGGNAARETEAVNEWAGLKRDDARPFVSMNDSGASFAEIADRIRAIR